MTNYHRLYRWGVTPWEGYAGEHTHTIGALLDREEQDPRRSLGGSVRRALDVGCGRGQYAPLLAQRGWETVGIDVVPAAVEAARQHGPEEVTYVVGDVTRLTEHVEGPFDFVLDVGCLEGLSREDRTTAGAQITEVTAPGATLLSLAFTAAWMRVTIEGMTEFDLLQALPGWDLLAAEAAGTAGLSWPTNHARPTWFRLRRR